MTDVSDGAVDEGVLGCAAESIFLGDMVSFKGSGRMVDILDIIRFGMAERQISRPS